MWFTYCGASSDRVALGTFVLAVASYLHERLSMPDHAVDAVLTPENREALTLAVDADSNGKVPCRQISSSLSNSHCVDTSTTRTVTEIGVILICSATARRQAQIGVVAGYALSFVRTAYNIE